MSAATAAAHAATKERIFAAAGKLMLQKSFHSVGLNEILCAVQVPKGSFYHYFPSKEQFGVELLEHHVAWDSLEKRRALLTTELANEPFERLLAYFELGIAKLLENDCQSSCLVVKLASEVATLSDSMRAVLAHGVRVWVGCFENVIVEGQSKGGIRGEIDAGATARMMHDLWMGASQRAQVERSVAPLREVALFVRHHLTAA